MGEFLWAFWRKIRKTVYFQGADLKISGQKLAPQKILAPFLDSKFAVDYDFAIKHDPIQSDD